MVGRSQHSIRHSLLRVIVFTIAVVASSQPGVAEPIEQIPAIRLLSREDAARRLPVSISGTVVFSHDRDKVFVLMADEAIWCAPQEGNDLHSYPRVEIGDDVTIKGNTRVGHGPPIVLYSELEVAENGPPVSARPSTFAEIHTSSLDAQLVSVEGVVRSVSAAEFSEREALLLSVFGIGGNVDFVMTSPPDFDPKTLIDCEVRVTGIVKSVFNNRAEFLESTLVSSDPDGLEILSHPPHQPFEIPISPLGALRGFSPDPDPRHRQRIRGTVIAAEKGRRFFLGDGSRAIRVETGQKDGLAPGDQVEASGFVEIENHYPVLKNSIFRVKGRADPPQPIPVTRERVLAVRNSAVDDFVEDFHARLVTVRGRLAGLEVNPGLPFRIHLDCEGTLVSAALASGKFAGSLWDLQEGSELAVTGICTLDYSTSDGGGLEKIPTSFSLLMRSEDDVEVIRSAPWWTPGRLATALSAILVLLAISLLGNEFLRRRVALRGAELAESMRARRDLEVETEATLKERQRLAADLHDNLAQTLTGVALQIHATHTAPDTPLASRNLVLAEKMLTQSREELRRSVWNLHPAALEGSFLREALRDICADIFEGTEISVTVDGKGEEEAIGRLVAENLFLLAKEAVTNAAKHASPRKISVSIDYPPDRVVLRVSDDGTGFDPPLAPGSHEGHFGLSGMRERARRLGSELQLKSKPGHGTEISVSVPRRISD